MGLETKCVSNRIKEFDFARVIATFLMIAVHTEFSIYNFTNPVFGAVFTNLGSPFCAPIFMFILGANVYSSSKNKPKLLLVRGIKILVISYIFNIICHALPFFILDYINGIINYGENALHWIFAVDILTFAGLAFIFMAFVRKLNINNKLLLTIGVIFCLINFYLVKNYQIDFDSNPLLAGFTSLFYNSSMPGYFSFLGWIIFPIAGYIFIQFRNKTNDLDKFYLKIGSVSLFVYIVMIILTYKFDMGTWLIYPAPDNAYYYMHPYQALGYLFFTLAWISILYFVAKICPAFLDKHINRINKNLTLIYLIQWFVINYFLMLPSNYSFFANEWQYILCFISVIIVSDLLAYLYKKYFDWSKK